jgi:hypothetical protein
MISDSQNNTSATLRQGVNFKNYQKKIVNSVAKKNKQLVEGFTTDENLNRSQNLVSQVDMVQNAARELEDLKARFLSILQRYQAANAQLLASTTSYINAPAPTNPTIGKNVFVNTVVSNPTSDFVGAYVDNASTPTMTKLTANASGYTFAECQEAALNSGNQYFGLSQSNATTQKATCSTSNSLSDIEKYGVAGANCVQGSDGNLYGGDLTNAIYEVPDAQFVGNYGDSPNRAMPTFANGGSRTYTYKTCKTAAINGGYNLFGLQWYSGGNTGYAQCALSNDFEAATRYGQSGRQSVNGQGQTVGGGWANAIYAVQSNGTYVGCYNDSATSPAMTAANNGSATFSVDTCQQYAIQNGYRYYGLQGGNADTSKCFVSNSLQASQKYGESTPTSNFSDGKKYGNNLVNSVYKLGEMGFPEYMGKIGHVNNDGSLSEYPSSMIKTVNNSPTIIDADNSCSPDITNINSIQWENYKKIKNMTPNTKCGLGTAIQADQSSVEELGRQLENISAGIIRIIKYLESLDSNIISQVGLNKQSLDSMMTQYNTYNNKFLQYKTVEYKNINGILSESGIVTKQENYSYILWSALAVTFIMSSLVLIRKTSQ